MKWHKKIALKLNKSTIHHEKQNNTIVDEIEIIKQCNIDEGYVF
ncbi:MULTISPECIES: hypothetical protein [unclassified Serratia (in: enterobacteria)]